MHVSIDYVGFVELSLKMADLHSFVIDLSMEDTSFGRINKLWVGLKISVIISFDNLRNWSAMAVVFREFGSIV
jgi:hypothetical protein